MKTPRLLLALVLFIVAVALTGAATAATITVNSTGDTAANDGQCTLREAITSANTDTASGAMAGECVAGSGSDTIQFNVGSGNPTIITSGLPGITTVVTIDGATGGATRVELNGNGANASGLFFDHGGTAGSIVRNLVINRFVNGIYLNAATNVTITGNYIGTNSAGTTTSGFGNSQVGIFLASSSTNTIGGTTGTAPGGSCTGVCNIISGSGIYGINLEQNQPGGSDSNTIQGNFIGTDVTGTIPLGNNIGIRTFNNAANNQIGGTATGAGNVISGNGNGGIELFAGGNAAQGMVIQGNYIGTNSAGTAVLGNGSGIEFIASQNGLTIGGSAAGAGNVIAGNSVAGIHGGLSGSTIQGNFIGTDKTGKLSLSNGTVNSALEARGGISLLSGSGGNTIGGAAPGQANVVAFNIGAGVRLGADNFTGSSGSGNKIIGNVIYRNNGLGISLGNGGGIKSNPVVNDIKDPDSGANNLQNYPILTSVNDAGGTITVQGTFNSLPTTSFALDFYVSQDADSSGNGEGQMYVGTQNVTTDANGDASITFSYPTVPGMPYTTATATSPTNDTSEFSNAIFIANPGQFVFSSATYSIVESGGTATITVNRVNGTTGAACVTYATSDGTADSSDYTAASGQLCFADGDTSKTFTVAITSDTNPEPDETINLTLSAPTNGGTVGFQGSATLTIINDDSFQTFVVNSTADTDDGACTVALCTLRDAIKAANATPQQDTISFNIGSGNPTITVASALPTITAPVVIDGSAGPGGATRVEINGNNISASGLSLNSGGSRSIIRRLVINRFANSGINLADSSNNVIEANYIGTDATGTIARGNGGGINFTSANNNLIGGTMGTTPGGGCSGSCNLISGNGGSGINSDPQGGSANGNMIQGNFIGTDVTGTVALGNGGRGITFLNAVNTTQIGGNSPNARNLISGNANDIGIFMSAAGTHDNVIQGNYIGVNTSATAKIPNAIGVVLFFTATNNSILNNVISGNSESGVDISTNGGPPNFPPHDNIVRGNFIGTDPTGTLDLGNGTAGFPNQIPVGGVVLDQGVFNNQIGGTSPGDANVIAFNIGAGIRLGAYTGAVAAGSGNSLLNNSIYSNNGLGIALGDGNGILTVPLVNDINDPDTGANNRQNYPTLATPPTSSGGMVTVGGPFNSLPSTAFTIQFFVSASPDALSTNGEGQTFVGSQTVTTDSGGNASVSFTYAARIGKQYITVTATNNATGDTSEFSNFVVDPTPQSNPPVVTANDASGNPNQPITVTASFTDSDGTPPYTATIDCGNMTTASGVMVTTNSPTSGTVSGVCTYTTPSSYTATVTVSDSAGIPGSDTSTVTVNAPPVASDGNVTTNEDTAVSGNLSASDPDGGTLTYSIVANPTKGTLTAFDSATGSFTYTPTANLNGPDSFTFKVNDGQADSNTATESITINPVNDPPTANNQAVTTNEDTAVSITLTGSDVDGDPLSFTVATAPAHGTVVGSGPNRTYTPSANYNGPDSFTFTTNDGNASSAPATVSITVTAVNDPPTANGQSVTTNEDTAKPITLTGSDVDGDSLTFSIVSGPAHGTLTGAGSNRTYTPNANYNGADSFTFKANDGQVDSAPATVDITVVAVNDAPSFTKGPNQTVNQGAGPQSIPNWATNISAGPADESGQSLTFMVSNNNTTLFSSQPAISSNGTLTYTPAASAGGSATVTVVLMDNGGTANGGQDTSAPQTFTITVAAPTPTPTATATATATATPTATATATITPSPTPSPTPKGNPSPAQTLNISSRLRVSTGDNVMIAGFIITGNAPKPVIIRGMGPSLTASQVPADKVLLDPVIELHGPNGSLITSNDNWKDSPQRSQIEGTPFQPTDDREAVIVATLQPGPYTAIISGKNATTGIGLIEVYDNNQTVDSTLANLSTRGFVMIQENVIIGGFMLGNNPNNTRIAIRGLGPSLASSGLTNLLADPTLELHDANGAVLVSNDNWQDDPVSAALLTANGLAPHDVHEAGIATILPAGSFTAILAGQPPGTGIGLIEIYNLQ